MEKLNEMEQKWLMEELIQGKESAKQLKDQISLTTTKETCEHLVHKIVSSYDKALELLLKLTMLMKQDPSLECNDDVGFKRGRAKDHYIKTASKKRKTLVKWTKQVLVTSEIGLEGALNDGYSWRKYGQKDILGAIHPRAYYRCTHRHTSGCQATKQVQRSDEDSSVVEVTYIGNHTCLDTSICASSLMALENEEPKEDNDEKYGILKSGLPLTIENEPFPSFPPIQSEKQSIWETFEEDTILDSCSPGFQSSSASESNYLITSPCQMNLYNIESDLGYVVSTLSSVGNPALQFNFPVEMEFDVSNIEYYFS